MNFEESDSPAPAPAAPFDPHQLVQALKKFSQGLWTTFVGCCLILAAFVVTLLAVPRWLPQSVILFSGIAFLVGVIMMYAGKHTAYSFEIPLRYRRYLAWSYWCDIGMFVCRMFRRAPPPVNLFAMLGSTVLGLLSLWFLLRFIYHLAGLIEARWARRLAWFCQSSLLLLVALGIVVAFLRQDPANAWLYQIAVLTLFALALGAAATFLFLLAAMSFALKSFSHYLQAELAGELAE